MSAINKKTLTSNIFEIVDWFRIKNYINQKSISDNNDDKSLIPTISQLKVMKLLYYVQGVSLSFYNMRAFSNKIYHWEYGPAISEVHNKYRGCTALPDLNNKSAYSKAYANYQSVQNNPKLYNVVEAVDQAYGGMSAYGLMIQTHKEAPWFTTDSSAEIKPEVIKSYFDKNIVE